MVRCVVLLAWVASAVTLAELVVMPDGRAYPEECVHRLSEEHLVESAPGGRGDVLVRRATGERTEMPPCGAGGGMSLGVREGAAGPARRRQGARGYYSDWIVDTVSVHEAIGGFTSNWTVPKAPISRGPLPGMSSVYIFNGLENGGGEEGAATMILQPVLSYGKSGCVLNPLAGWRFTPFQVTQAGRAYCGPSLEVGEGDVLQGRMERLGGDSWRVTADAGPKGRSVHTLVAAFRANAAYLTLEGMVIYSCGALPGTGVAFRGNVLEDAEGHELPPAWRTELRHTECRPAARVVAGGRTVELDWNATASAAFHV